MSERIYKVYWKDKRPYVAVGKLVMVGKKRKVARGDFGGKLLEKSTFSDSALGAIELEISNCARWYGPPNLFSHKDHVFRPWALVNCLCSLNRLQCTLSRHGIIQ